MKLEVFRYNAGIVTNPSGTMNAAAPDGVLRGESVNKN